jgi:hypothetical protein
VVDGLTVVLGRGDRAGARVVVGEHVAPRAHPREIDLLVGERHRDAGPVGRGGEIEIAPELLGQVGEERLVSFLRLRRRRLQGPTPKRSLAPWASAGIEGALAAASASSESPSNIRPDLMIAISPQVPIDAGRPEILARDTAKPIGKLSICK